MPRAGQTRTAPATRLSDRIAVSLLMWAFPPKLVDRVIADCGRTEQRSRLLPARLVLYFVLAMCLFSSESYHEVAKLLAHGMNLAGCAPREHWLPTTAALSRARAKLGPEPLKALFAAVARPDVIGRARGGRPEGDAPGRVRTLHGAVFGVPDSPGNRERFGSPVANGCRRPDLPQVRVLTLTDQDAGVTRAVFGPGTVSQTTLAGELLAGLADDDLLLVCDCLAHLGLWPTMREASWATDGGCLHNVAGHEAGAPPTVLRSRSPEGIEQEVWGYLLIQLAVRSVLSPREPEANAPPS